jgi:hypothetical protein
MSKETRRLNKLNQHFSPKPDNRPTSEKIAEMMVRREAASSIGRNPGENKRKK